MYFCGCMCVYEYMYVDVYACKCPHMECFLEDSLRDLVNFCAEETRGTSLKEVRQDPS